MIPLTVIGVLESKGTNSMGQDQDDIVLAPYTTVMKRILAIDYIQGIFASAVDEAQTEETIEGITELLRARHKIQPDADDDFDDTFAAGAEPDDEFHQRHDDGASVVCRLHSHRRVLRLVSREEGSRARSHRGYSLRMRLHESVAGIVEEVEVKPHVVELPPFADIHGIVVEIVDFGIFNREDEW